VELLEGALPMGHGHEQIEGGMSHDIVHQPSGVVFGIGEYEGVLGGGWRMAALRRSSAGVACVTERAGNRW